MQPSRGDTLDVVLLVLAALSAVRGYRRGLLYSLFSSAGFVLGAIVGSRVAPSLVNALLTAQRSTLAADKAVLQRALTVVVVLAVAVAAEYIAGRVAAPIRQALRMTPVGLVDGAGGATLSVLGVLLIAWMIGTALGTAPYRSVARQIHRSKVLAVVNVFVPTGARGQFTALLHGLEAHSFPALTDPLGSLPQLLAPVAPPDAGVVPGALRAAGSSVVKIVGEAPECSRQSEGSGFVISPDHIMTNAHVVAGLRSLTVTTPGPDSRTLTGRVVLFDSRRDVAIVAVPGLARKPLSFAGTAQRGASGVVVGYPENGPFTAVPARVEGRQQISGPDIYQQATVTRDIYSLRANIRPGNSGGPLLTPLGLVDGVVFAASTDTADEGYALTTGEVAPDLAAGRGATGAVSTRGCD
ncbi:MAG: Serine protease [Frankiales bacterium]|nr:Serine protease [Frankiales bacterium]